VGDTPANLAMDREQLRSAAYTPKQAAAQIRRLSVRFGAEGDKLVGGADAFREGVNAAQEKLSPGGPVLAPGCPAKYAALQQEVLVGPGVEARGVSFAGTQFVVELARRRLRVECHVCLPRPDRHRRGASVQP